MTLVMGSSQGITGDRIWPTLPMKPPTVLTTLPTNLPTRRKNLPTLLKKPRFFLGRVASVPECWTTVEKEECRCLYLILVNAHSLRIPLSRAKMFSSLHFLNGIITLAILWHILRQTKVCIFFGYLAHVYAPILKMVPNKIISGMWLPNKRPSNLILYGTVR